MNQDAFVTGMTANATTETILVILGGEDASPPGFLLGASRLVIGAGEQDDVFLSGVGVVPSHLRVVFVDGRITVLSAAQEIRVDGVPVSAYPFDWMPLQVLSLSHDTHVSYGPVGSAWPAVPVWETPEVPEGDGGQREEAAQAADADAAPLSAAAEDDAFSAALTTREKVHASARLGVLVLVVASLVVVALVMFDLIWGHREVVVPQEHAIERSEDVLEQLLKSDRVNYRSVRLDRRLDGAISLSGFIDSEEAFRQLSEQVRQQVVNSGGNVRLDALTVERLSALVRDHLVSFPLGYSVESDGEQVNVLVFGVQPDAMVLDRLKLELSRLGERIAPRKLQLDFKLQPAELLVNDVVGALARTPVTRDMQVSVEANGLRITGLVAVPVESEARALLDKVKDDFAERVPLALDLKVDPKLNFTVVSLTQGGNESSATLMMRGKTQTFRLGDAVFGAGELREVSSDGVIIALGRREMFIPILR
jgi:hypothetical protein